MICGDCISWIGKLQGCFSLWQRGGVYKHSDMQIFHGLYEKYCCSTSRAFSNFNLCKETQSRKSKLDIPNPSNTKRFCQSDCPTKGYIQDLGVLILAHLWFLPNHYILHWTSLLQVGWMHEIIDRKWLHRIQGRQKILAGIKTGCRFQNNMNVRGATGRVVFKKVSGC